MKKTKPLTFGTVTETIPEGKTSFVYAVLLQDGMTYIGIKKALTEKKYPPLKGKMRKRIKTKETDWKTYTTSNTYVQEQIQLGNVKEYRIIKWCESVTELKAWEAYLQLDCYLKGNWHKLINEMVNLRLRIRK